MPRIFTVLQQAHEGTKAVAAGMTANGASLSDGITPPRLSAFLAKCRDGDPEVGIHLAEIPLPQQIEWPAPGVAPHQRRTWFGAVQCMAGLESA